MKRKIFLSTMFITAFLLSGCATESSRSLEVAKVASYGTQYNGPRSPISVGKFDNRSSYMSGLFLRWGRPLGESIQNHSGDTFATNGAL